nr:hypothetical protein [Methanoculleus marisnigri]
MIPILERSIVKARGLIAGTGSGNKQGSLYPPAQRDPPGDPEEEAFSRLYGDESRPRVMRVKVNYPRLKPGACKRLRGTKQ